MNIALVRTPRYVWPFNSETSAFWQPLGFMSLAGQIEKTRPDWSVRIIDCPGSKIGWRTLLSMLDIDRPDVICLGEEMVSSPEAIRLAETIKQRRPETIVIAGGVYFSYAGEPFLRRGLIDYIVHGEGEITLCELLGVVADGGDVRQVMGVSCFCEDKVVRTPSRPLLDDMDLLPMPSWSRVPMSLYGQGSKNHPGLVSIEHSRGCTDRCSFCILWKHMGKCSADEETIVPCYRTKSPERCVEEVCRLFHDHGRRTFGWVDPTWNADPNWTDRFCSLLLKQNLPIRQTAWVRADCIVRDEALGILEKAVRAGLRQVMIGVERVEDADLCGLGKHANGPDTSARAFEILRTRYPSVFTIGSVIFGVWEETRQSLNRLSRYRYQVGMDYCFFIPLTPNPGTETYEMAQRQGLIEVHDPHAYNFHTPVMRTRHFTTRQLERLYFRLLFGVSIRRIGNYIRRLSTVNDRRRKSVFLSLLRYGTQISGRYILGRLRHPFSNRPTVYSRKPAWYDS